MHLQVALDDYSVEEAKRFVALAAPLVDSIEVGTPMLIREGLAIVRELHALLAGTPCALFVDTKISDEGPTIARLCLEAGADAVSVVDGASTHTLKGVRAMVDEYGKQVWVDLLYHSNPIIRGYALAPYVDGFVLHRPYGGFPPPLLDGLVAMDRPLRLAGGVTLERARRAVAFERSHRAERAGMAPMEGLIVGRAITQADDVARALADFVALCRFDAAPPP